MKNIDINLRSKTVIIGERVNPTGKEKLSKAMKEFDLPYILEIVNDQIKNGCTIVDINVGAEAVDESKLFSMLAKKLSNLSVTACFDSFNVNSLESALENYQGRAIVNSASSANKDYEKIIKLASKHKSMIILLPYQHKTNLICEDRIEALTPLLECAYDNGLTKDDILVDGVVMAVSSDIGAPKETVKFIAWCKEQGLMTVAGVSNVSFGLPNRSAINREFLSILVNAGLTAAIIDPIEEYYETITASYLLRGKDEWCMEWIEKNRYTSLNRLYI
ncbi:MAG: dihydropteroate synthase [Clostridiales bacterium]|nr:dihydropteroate synthase [Clostridiales bacterium]